MVVNGYKIKALADLHGANLRGANLRGANLRYADLRYADLRYADLHGANLRYADLHGANLRGADLHGANFYGANLRYVNLRGADLHGANLDFSCWPLWCGSKNVKLDAKQIDQLCLHLAWVWKKAPAGVIKRAERAAKRRNVTLGGK